MMILSFVFSFALATGENGARADITAAYPTYPASYKAGWGYMLLTNFLPRGGLFFIFFLFALEKKK